MVQMSSELFFAKIPLQWVGPVRIRSSLFSKDVELPLATFESPLWPSCQRGAKACQRAGFIDITILDDRMTRSCVLEAKNAKRAHEVMELLKASESTLQEIVQSSSRFAKLLDVHYQIVGNLLYLRFEMKSGEASGHNMVTKASENILNWILNTYKDMQYVSVSANFCTDKKVSCVNGILGRGKSVIAEIVLPRSIVLKYLKTTPEKIVDLNIKKNLIGSILAGSLRSANAHYANMLLGIYLATGQDAANIVEGSQGITFCQLQGDDLYFSVNLPNIIVGTVGNGKDLDFVKENLQRMDLVEKRADGENSQRLASYVAAIVLCGELSLLAAQTNPGELVKTHMDLERKKSKGE